MLTLEYFGTDFEFTLFRPIFMTLLVISFLLFVAIIIPAFKKMINGFTVVSLTVGTIFVGSQLVYYGGILVDEFGLAGDSVSFFMFFLIVTLGVVNFISYYLM